jgi:DNA-binding NarL/FixJ family response regulator
MKGDIAMSKKEKILIIDDESDFTEAFRRTMEAKAFNVNAATSRAQAQDMMKDVPDVIVLGTLSPAGQAFDLHQWLKQHPRYKEIPLMVIDARDEERNIRGWRKFEGLQLVSDDYVSKPVEPALLVPRIQSLLEELTRIIKVLVADDHTMVRDGICAVLGLQKDIYVVGEAVDGRDAYEKASRLLPHVTLMDIVMPVMNGLEATRLISKECPQTKVLVLTQYDEDENIRVAKEAGAFGFIPKRGASSDLVTGIRSVSGGKHFPATFAELSTS